MQQSGNSLKDPLYTNRIESKYVINQTDLDDVFDILESKLKLSFPSKNTTYTNISSTYLDTVDMKFLKQHTTDKPDRYKLRVRIYAPNGKWEEDKFLEVKYQINFERRKTRIRVDGYGLMQALGGLPIPAKMRKLNPDITDDQFNNAKDLIDSLTKEGVQPTTKVTYRRVSYKGKDLRCTVDRNLKVEACANSKNYQPSAEELSVIAETGNKFNPSTNAILEIKYPEDKETPAWLDKVITDYKVGEPGFSKYLWGLDQVLK